MRYGTNKEKNTKLGGVMMIGKGEPWHMKEGDNSLNLAQAHLTLALAASSTPPPASSVSPK